MPWDGTRLWVADIDDQGAPQNVRHVAGSETESIFQPSFDQEGDLIFTTDQSDWWNVVKINADALDQTSYTPQNLAPMDAEFGAPQWVFGMTTWCEAQPNLLVSAYTQNGIWRLGKLDAGRVIDLDVPYSSITAVQSDGAGRVFFIGGSPDCGSELVCISLAEEGQLQVISDTKPPPISSDFISRGEPVSFPSANGRTAHAFFYPPCHAHLTLDPDDKPPLVVKSHGGPTSATSNALDLGIQFWTTRGFAVVDVNYGGSTGYGREYREALKGQWGIVDVEDCVAAAEFLSEMGRVDAKRRAIRGGSAGGYTTLASLAFTDTFQTGASHFGVADLEALAQDTHKFESRYLDGLIGPYPECKDLYRERAPLHSAHRIQCPVIFFQGLDDRVVPPNQAELMVDALNANGIPNKHITFEGEGHGFRKAENIAATLDTELDFYRDIFKLKG
jgi:dipeptidyl aminopeptidase/acylaminoacyl peptidase